MITCENKGLIHFLSKPHQGCNKPFNESSNPQNSCQFHPGSAIFHEGLKVYLLFSFIPQSWSCCQKKVLDFDAFLAIPGCCFGVHSSLKMKIDKEVKSESGVMVDGKEVYGNVAKKIDEKIVEKIDLQQTGKKVVEVVVKKVKECDLNDDLDLPIPEGTKCKRAGCSLTYTHTIDRSSTDCVYHPGSAIFHEGSKGWSCCPRKVLEFDEFLKLKGCKEGRHRFLKRDFEEEVLDCRFDWYQTQTSIIVSVFAKNVDPTKTIVELKPDKVNVKVVFKDGKKGSFNTNLCQDIDVGASKLLILSTKIELNLRKGNGLSWPSLEPSSNVTSFTTFGTPGGTGGSIGSKEALIASDSPIALLKKA